MLVRQVCAVDRNNLEMVDYLGDLLLAAFRLEHETEALRLGARADLILHANKAWVEADFTDRGALRDGIRELELR